VIVEHPDSAFCVSCLQESFGKFGPPDIVNTEQVSQFNSKALDSAVRQYSDVRISMDGRGRALDNVFVERLRHCLIA
jgi:putative transposase